MGFSMCISGLHRASQVWKQVAELAAVGGLARGSSVTGSSHSLAQERGLRGNGGPGAREKIGRKTMGKWRFFHGKTIGKP